MHCVDLGESFPTNILNYFLAKFGFDTAKNEPFKIRLFDSWVRANTGGGPARGFLARVRCLAATEVIPKLGIALKVLFS